MRGVHNILAIVAVMAWPGAMAFAEDAPGPDPAEPETEAREGEENAGEEGEGEAGNAESGEGAEVGAEEQVAEGGESSPESEGVGAAERPEVATAQMRFQYGLRLARSENWRAALVEFDASIAALPNRSALYNRALCLRNLYRYPEAIEAFQHYLEFAGADMEAAHRAEIDALIATMGEMLTNVSIEVNQPGATIFVDDREVGTSPLEGPQQLLAGRHEVRVALPGFVTIRQDVQVVTGRELSLDLTLEEEPRQGVLLVDSNVTEAVVWVDGEEVGLTGHPLLIDAGAHTIEVRSDGYRPGQRRLLVEADREQQVEVNIERPFRFPRSVFWSTVGLTVAGLLATAGLGISVAVLDGQYDPHGDDAPDRFDRGEQLMIGTDAALGVTLTAASVALIFGFFTDWRRPRQTEPAETDTATATFDHSGSPENL